MVLKRSSAEDGNDDDSRTSTCNQKFRKIVEHVRQEDYIQEIVAKVEPIFRRVVRQELEAALGPLDSSQRFSLSSQPEPSTSTRTLQLDFVNKPCATFFTNTKVLAEGHDSFVTIQLIDANSKEVVSDAPFGSMEVYIFAMEGGFISDGQEDCNKKALNDGAVREREGRRPLLVGELSFSLTQGIGYIKDVIFTDNSSWLRSRRFRLGVRAVQSQTRLNGVQIKQGISEAFVVLEHRGDSYRKHDIPFLNDPLWRLKRISKNGAICTKLSEKGIHTVKDFLQLYHINPNFLRQIVESGVTDKTWESIVRHANMCCLDNTLYAYFHAANELVLVLNCVYKLLGVTFDGLNYQSVDALNKEQMALVERLQHYIYDNPNVLCPIDAPSTYPSTSYHLQNNDPLFSPSFDHWGNNPHITSQGNSLDATQSDPSPSNTYILDDTYNLEEDFTAYQSQPIEQGHWSSSSELDNLAYEWNPLVTDENITHQSSVIHPVVTTWATTSSSKAQNVGASCKSKACWVKIRALLKWKMVKRVAAKKKGKLQLGYHRTQVA